MPQANHPPTIIVVHPKERRSKCSVEPLRGWDEFTFWKYPNPGDEPLDNYVRLGFGGPTISEADDGANGLLVLDGTWKLAGRMEAAFEDIPIRSLPPTETAYPRKSKIRDDPHGGLATIEAIFVAYQLLGRSTKGLLDDYYWRDRFLEMNGFDANSARS